MCENSKITHTEQQMIIALKRKRTVQHLLRSFFLNFLKLKKTQEKLFVLKLPVSVFNFINNIFIAFMKRNRYCIYIEPRLGGGWLPSEVLPYGECS